MREVIHTDKTPAVIGSYSQAIKVNNVVYLSGQIPLDPVAMVLVEGDVTVQVKRVFDNIKIIAEAAGGHLDAIVRLSVYLVDLSHSVVVNEVMKLYFKQAFPARTMIGVVALPKGALVEIDAVMVLE